jgi:hypothetical protein
LLRSSKILKCNMQKCISKQLISTSNSIIAKCEPELSVVEEKIDNCRKFILKLLSSARTKSRFNYL